MDPSIYRLRQRDILALCVLALLCLGTIMVQSASMSVTGAVKWQWTPLGIKQFGFCFVALATFLLVGRTDYARFGRPTRVWWNHPAVWLLLFTCALNALVLVPGVGISKNGAQRWLPLGFTQLQPSELAKWSAVLFLAWWLTTRPLNTDRFFAGFLPTLAPIGVICLLIVIQDFGTAALIAIASLTMLLAGRIKLWHLLAVVPPVLGAAAWFVMHKTYRWKRMIAFTDPWANPQREGYHMIQSLLSFSTGGVTGKGLGNGIQKLGYLPEDTTDFIFAVICEEIGLFGALLTVALYLGILYVAWQAVKRKSDDFGRMLAFGIGAMVGLQAAINIAVATVSVPTKGLSLPLISAGGSGLIITCAALGLLLSVTKFDHSQEEMSRPLERATDRELGDEADAAPAATPFDLIQPEPATVVDPTLA
ncbi:MAG TPA: putative peptidoglycan glycosyltransferase FtsW [Tepidisphaeraceae bacterium]|nr:putative peptidoglycan glycosyltransferase FtsW [Tepidisphaeraceae bacterium]